LTQQAFFDTHRDIDPPPGQTLPTEWCGIRRRRTARLQVDRPTALSIEHIAYKIASTQNERKSAFQLVYKSYVEAGLTDPNLHQMRVSPHHLLPTTQSFVAITGGKVVFNSSLVSDNALGLPMEAVFPAEVERRREQGHRLAEVTCLANCRATLQEPFRVFLNLCRLIFQYARQEQIQQILIAVHPRHVGFYQRMLRFEIIGRQRDYPMVKNWPAVPMTLDFAVAKEKYPAAYEKLLGTRLAADILHPKPMSWAQRTYFAPMIDISPKAKPALPA